MATNAEAERLYARKAECDRRYREVVGTGEAAWQERRRWAKQADAYRQQAEEVRAKL